MIKRLICKIFGHRYFSILDAIGTGQTPCYCCGKMLNRLGKIPAPPMPKCKPSKFDRRNIINYS